MQGESRSTGLVWVVCAAALASCKAEFDDRNSEVTGVRILAVQSDPAEGSPGTSISFRALAVDMAGGRPDLLIDWAFCTQPKPTSELNDTTLACFAPRGDPILPFGALSTDETATLPLNACNQFGPDVPQIAGQPASRPTDPDATGGYYQPVRLLVDMGGQYSFTLAQTRIACNLPGATADVLLAYRQFYHRNRNPDLERVIVTTRASPAGIEFVSDGVSVDGLVPNPPQPLLEVERGDTIRIAVTWAACASSGSCGDGACTPDEGPENCPVDCTLATGCPGAEPYVSFDLVTRTLVLRRESVRISWYANGGAFRDDRTGAAEEDAAYITQSENEWTAPNEAGTAMMWLVVRDSRGGVSWKSLQLTVR